VALALLLAWLAGPYAPWHLPGDPSLIPAPGQSRVHTVLVGVGWAAVLNVGLCLLLLATAGLWAQERGGRRSAAPRPSAWLVGACVAAALVAGGLRWPLVRGSLWWDEAWSVRHTIVGQLEPEGQELRFEPAAWLDTLWSYRAPTNHVAYSVAGRPSHRVWRAASGAAPERFDERALRLPAWLAALASVVGVGLLVFRLGFPGAAPAAAWLLAVHPWHIRFGSDGRGYSFVVLFTLLAALLLLRALQEDRWRWWLGYGAAQALLLWTLPIAVYLPLALSAAGAAAIALGPRAERGRLLRLVVANLVAAGAYLQVMAPNLAQAALLERLLGEEAHLDLGFARRLLVFATTGLHVRMPSDPDVWFPTLETMGSVRGALLGVGLPLLAATGAVRGLRRGGAGAAILAGLLAAPALLILHRAVDGFFAYTRFAIYALVPATACLAIGVEGLLRSGVRPPKLRRALVPAGLVAGVVAYQVALWPLTRVLLRHPHAPTREVAGYRAPRDRSLPGRIERLGIGLGGDVPRIYDPWIREVTDPAELVAALARARAEERPLYVIYGYGPMNRRRHPALMALVDDRRLFEPLARFDGIESLHVYRVLRYGGAPLSPPAADVAGDRSGGLAEAPRPSGRPGPPPGRRGYRRSGVASEE
jgi:Dolichyl-phosphate-mannose-protein mannosyltransferase